MGEENKQDFNQELLKALRDIVDNNRWKCCGTVKSLVSKRFRRLISEDGEDIVLIHVPPDQFYAMDASCPHEGGPLDQGDIEDIGGYPCVVCPWHDYDFRLDNGESTYGLVQQTYTVKVLQDKVYINTPSELIMPDVDHPEINQNTSDEVMMPLEIPQDDTLCSWAVKILCTADPQEKVRLTHEVEAKWKSGEITEIGTCAPPDQPARQEDLQVLAPGKIKRGKAGTKASRIAVLHSLANIEQWAIDLSWDVIARFSDFSFSVEAKLPREFFSDFVKVAGDEAKHYKLIEERIKDLGSHFGALPVHNGLWQSARETKDSLLARLAVVHMVHEARGLDVHPTTQARFERQKDGESVDLLEVIYTDEITHVAAGMKWFTYVCDHSDPPIDCIPKFHELVKTHFRPLLKPSHLTQMRCLLRAITQMPFSDHNPEDFSSRPLMKRAEKLLV